MAFNQQQSMVESFHLSLERAPFLPLTQKKRRQVIHLSEDLFQGEREVIIRHKDTEYRLRHTKMGKLILNK